MGLLGLGKKNKTTIVGGVVDLVTGIRKMVDDKNFTPEEKARFDKETAVNAALFVKDSLSESTERSKTRRSVAVDTVRFFFALIIFEVVVWKYDTLWFNAVKELIIQFKLPEAFIMIMVFFFGGYYLNKFIGGKNKGKQ